jgi:hypothetical protein
MLPNYRFNTHTDVIAPGQAGKTSLDIYATRRHILGGNQVVRMAWKADSYEANVAFTAIAKPEYKVVLLNPSKLEPLVPYNPFRLPAGRDLSAHVENLARSIVQTVSSDRTRDLPTYSESAEPFFAYLAVSGETPFTARRLFDFTTAKEWLYAAEKVPEPYDNQFRRIAHLKDREFDLQTGTLRRRLRPFVNSTALRRFTGSPAGKSVSEYLVSGHSIFFNGAPSSLLSVESARIVNGLFIADLLQFGIENATGRTNPIFVTCDEIQEFAPDDFASVIDLVLGAKLRFAILHHHGDQLNDRLRMSVETNARIKILGGGLSPDVRKHYAEIAYAAQINELHKKQPRIGYKTNYLDDERITTTEHPTGEISTTTSPFLRPEPEEVITGYEFFSREEVVSRYAQKFLVPDRTFTAILPNGRVEQFTVPRLVRYLYDSEECLKFIETHPFREQEEAPNTTERSTTDGKRKRKVRRSLFNAG